MYPTHQFTRHSPGISGHHRPRLQSLTAHPTLMPVLPLSYLLLFTKVFPNPLICVLLILFFFFHHPAFIIPVFLPPLSPLFPFFGVSLSHQSVLSLSQDICRSQTPSESLTAPQWFSPEAPRERQLELLCSRHVCITLAIRCELWSAEICVS